MIHIYPENDWIEHVTEGTGCLCCPRVEWESVPLVIHNAIDGRE